MKSSKVLFGCLIIIAFTTAASADWEAITDPIPLLSLPGSILTVGDKEFSDFDLDITIMNGDPFVTDTNNMKVQGVRDIETGDYGLRFNGFLWYAGPDQALNVNLGFKVSILDEPQFEDYLIKDISLYLTGAGATGDGKVDASEIVWDNFPDGNDIARPMCWYYANDAQLSDYWEFEPLKEIYVQTKHISLIGNSGTAYFSEFFQFYGSQVPEPATVSLLALGSLALLRYRRFRYRANSNN
jgi:hypothetical protein